MTAMATNLDFEPAEYIQIDLFPATVHPDGQEEAPIGEELRAIVTDNYFYVIQEVDGAVSFAVKEPLDQLDGSNKLGYTVTTENGAVYFFNRALNCGCGTRLRGIRVLPGVPPIPRHLRK
jgi:hypothetical protein